jgi:predicted Zn-dependent protease/tetratricopeptide (TPR) repeat protein
VRPAIRCAAILLCVACNRNRPAGPAPEAAAPEVSDAELKQFLSGMLVTSETPPVTEVVWPVQGTELAYQWVEESLKAGWGIANAEELRTRLQASPAKPARSDTWLLDRLSDYPSSLRVWKKLLHDDRNDLGAAIWLAELLEALEGPQAALDAIAGTSGRTARIVDPRGRKSSSAQIEAIRCELLLLVRKPDEALKACNLATEIDESYAEVMVSPILLAMGRKKEALVQASVAAKAPGRMLNSFALFALGLAQQENGLDKEAIVTWNVALARWPRNARLLQAISGPRRSVFEWQEMNAVPRHRGFAKQLAFCGRLYSELKLDERAAECYRASERIQAGPALANKLVSLGTTSPEAALEQAKAAVKANPDVDLITAAAWLLFQMKNVHEAMQWVDRALAAEPYDVKASSLKWQLCGEQKDYVCLLQYRKRLGLPTHFDVAEYRDAERAFKEQAVKNGEGLAMRELDSASSPKPPPIREVEIIPLGNRTPPEMDHLADFLSTQFSGLKISVGSVEELPRGSYDARRECVIWDELVDKLRDQPGRIYVVEHDLGAYGGGFMYSRFDLAHARSVVSLSRLRSAIGESTSAPTTLEGDMLKAAQNRLRGQMIGAIAKLLGVSHPCTNQHCAMRENRSVADLSLHSPALCAAHAKELTDILAAHTSN